jgi:hypothetical protein
MTTRKDNTPMPKKIVPSEQMEQTLSENLSEGDDMKWICSILVAALLLQIGYVPCAAQEPVMLQGDEIAPQKRVTFAPGLRIRITAPSIAEHRFTGTLVKMGVDSLVLTREDFRRLAVPLASLTKLEANPGRKSEAILGVVVGLLAGGTTSVLLVDLSETVTYTKQVRGGSFLTQRWLLRRLRKTGSRNRALLRL